jgi:catechol 2,3-dioxygenase-like lactoylglutathione lyase family enzyme
LITPSWNKKVDVVTLFVDDLPLMKKFYLDVFGLPVHFEDSDSVVFKFGDTLINLLSSSAAPELLAPAQPGDGLAGPRFVLTINVPDVDAVAAELVERGVVLLNGPIDRPWGIRTASFRDPAGHVWEIAT